MRVTILRRPEGVINGMWAEQWRVGHTYDLSPNVASVLIVEGYACLEMRSGSDRRRTQRPDSPLDRRQVSWPTA